MALDSQNNRLAGLGFLALFFVHGASELKTPYKLLFWLSTSLAVFTSGFQLAAISRLRYPLIEQTRKHGRRILSRLKESEKSSPFHRETDVCGGRTPGGGVISLVPADAVQ